MAQTAEIRPPAVYGNEEETGLMIDKGNGDGFDEPYELTTFIDNYLPEQLEVQHTFLSNGGRIYTGGTNGARSSATNIERATPECANPSDLTTYIRSNEKLLCDAVSSYVIEKSRNSGNTVRARIQRRVVDSNESRKGCHDNFAASPESKLFTTRNEEELLKHAVLGHLATRSFVTGAGYVGNDHKLYYAQKIGGLAKTRGYGYQGHMYRYEDTEGGRLEVRCSDVNISDWAVRMRLGSTALAMMIAQTPLSKELPVLDSHNEMHSRAQRFNRLQLNPDGSLQPDRYMEDAVRYQRHLAEISLDELRKYTDDLDEDLRWTALELRDYCVDYQAVLSGDAPLSILADRADWSAKFTVILADCADRASSGTLASLSDHRSRALDFMYDYIGVEAKPGGKLTRPKLGYGYILRNRGHFRYTTPQNAIDNGVLYPPGNTRATERARIISKHKVASVNWHEIEYRKNGRSVTKYLQELRTDL